MNALVQSMGSLPPDQINALLQFAPRLAALTPQQQAEAINRAAGQIIVDETKAALTTVGIDYEGERAAFLDRLESPHTRRAYAAALGRLEKWTFRERINPLNLRHKNVDDFITFLKSEGRAAASTRRDIAAVSAFLSWMERRHEGAVYNTVRGTKERPKDRAKKQPKVPTAPEVKKIIAALPLHLAAAVSVMAFRGLRCGALPSLAVWGGRFTATSKGADISGELPPAALAGIEAAGLSTKTPFAGTVTNNLEKNIEYYMKKMYTSGAIKAPYSCHSFRHFFAVTEYKKDHDIHRVKELLGHSSIAITDRYLRSLGAL
ncbi:hypothetical protein FACS189479_05020 [Spirochaetia bacterium]|nr:hypothetical protein FACS189479_05020 [Spirochaetia bacterium]